MHTVRAHESADGAKLLMPKRLPAAAPGAIENIRNDFIPHPEQFPLRYRRKPFFSRSSTLAATTGSDVGLSFHSDKYVPAGTRLEIEIPLRGQVQRFIATVVMVRELDQGFEIGLWFATPDDALRARIVEKICHTECYLQARHGKEN
jgi:hypothetical protein